MTRLHIHASMTHFSRAIGVHIVRIGDPGKSLMAKPLEFEPMSEEMYRGYVEPTFTMQPEEAQQMIDALWHCGLRPSEGTGSAGQLAATQKHLDDMRRLVFEPVTTGGR